MTQSQFVLSSLSVVFVVFVLVSQGPKGEGLLQSMHSTRIFSSFGQTKAWLRFLTWLSITGFLAIHYTLALMTAA